MDRAYDALLLDLDGTLLDRRGRLHPENLAALRAAEQAGVIVMVATGRSKMATLPVLEQLGFDTPCVMFNGAAVYCRRTGRMLEERTLSNRTLERALAYGEQRDLLTIVMQADRKLVLAPRTPAELRALQGLHGLEHVGRADLRVDFTIRVTYISEEFENSERFAEEVEQSIGHPVYLTHFPLWILPDHRDSRMSAIDVHPPCLGKGEALRVLQELYEIPPSRVVAVGDATNDLPMIERAGLGVAMENSMSETLAAADRVIGHHDSPAIAQLVQELFLER